MTTFVIVRAACLQEDEGRAHLITTRPTREEAEAFIKDYCANGYFHRSDFRIAELE